MIRQLLCGGGMNSVEHVIDEWCERLEFRFSPDSLQRAPLANAVEAARVTDDSGTRSSGWGGVSIEFDDDTDLILRHARSFTVLVSSRWGRDPLRHWKCGQFLMRSMRQACCRGSVVLVAADSAVEPWALRASRLTGAQLLRVGFAKRNGRHSPQILVRCPENFDIPRDQGVIVMANHIDAPYVRRGGRIEHGLARWLHVRSGSAVRVGITAFPDCAASRLIDKGAVGWLLTDSHVSRAALATSAQTVQTHPAHVIHRRPAISASPVSKCTTHEWLSESGQWLVHCTRASQGKWPDQTLTQYRDQILTSDPNVARRTALDSLGRIIQMGHLVASAVVSSHRYPVVCWSAVPLLDLLRQRCFRAHVQRWDYEPYGVAVRVDAIHGLGGRPVIYGQSGDREKLAESDKYRFQALGKSASKSASNFIDWRKEKEWRLAQSLSLVSLNPADVRVFAADSCLARSRLSDLPWNLTLLRRETSSLVRKSGKRGLSEIWKAV